jgi:hypothetical protein
MECLKPSFSRLRLSTKASMNLTGFSFFHVSFERVWEEGCLVSVEAFYVFAHGSSVALKLV